MFCSRVFAPFCCVLSAVFTSVFCAKNLIEVFSGVPKFSGTTVFIVFKISSLDDKSAFNVGSASCSLKEISNGPLSLSALRIAVNTSSAEPFEQSFANDLFS